MRELKDIIKEVNDSVESVNLKSDDNTILDCAVRIYISENIQNGQKKKTEKKDTNASKKPTEKQKKYLKNLGYDKNPDNLTAREAQQLIKELKQKSDQKVNNDFSKK